MIVLFRHKPRCETDDGGVAIEKRVLAPPPPPVPYHLPVPPAGRVPSLAWLCLQRLASVPDQVHLLGVRLHYDEQRDVLDGEDDGPMDPRLWATLVQVYDNLPPRLHSLAVPLSDPHVPLLQHIPSTPLFSLLTLLDLPACPHLTDDTISALSQLHSLAAFDASATVLSPYGIKALASTLLWVDDGPIRRGPWPLRILRLRYCTNIDDNVFSHLSKFPLLSAIDLRGTGCTPNSSIPFRPASNPAFYHPSPLNTALSALCSSAPNLNSSENPYLLIINTLNHRRTRTKMVVAPQDSYVVLPSVHTRTESHIPPRSKKLFTGKSETLQMRKDDLEREFRYELNKAAWYARNPDAAETYHGEPNNSEDEVWDEDIKNESETSNDDDDLSDEDEDNENSASSSDEDENRLGYPPTILPQDAASETIATMPLVLPLTPSRPRRTLRTLLAMHLTPSATHTTPTVVPTLAQPEPLQVQEQVHPPTSIQTSVNSLSPHAISGTNIAPSSERPAQPVQDQSRSPLESPDLNQHLMSESLPQIFYNRGLVPKPVYDPEKDYSAETYYSLTLAGGSGGASRGRPTNRHDAFLMLYRDPPAWSMLDTYSAGLLAKSHLRSTSGIGAGFAAVNRAKIGVQIDQARIDALRESANAKRRSSMGLSHAHKTPLHNEAAAQGKNPFRRQSHSGLGSLPQASSSSNHTTTESGRKGELKPLKPISTVKVPLLPTNLRSQSSMKKTITASKSNVISEKKVKPGSGGIPLSSASFINNGSVSATPCKVKPPAPTAWAGAGTSGEGATPGMRSGSMTGNEVEVVRKKIKIKDAVSVFAGKRPASGVKKDTTTRSNGKKTSMPKQGFDWGAWGKPGQ